MIAEKITGILVESHIYQSVSLGRDVEIDFYLPKNVKNPRGLSLLLINDGQDLKTMRFEQILEKLYDNNELSPVVCVGIHCSEDRKNEYGTANIPDYEGRGAKAGLYTNFILKELLPFISSTYLVSSFKEISFAGFSLGGLSALDIVWNNQQLFTKAGVFSGSFWWRDKDQDEPDFDENLHRIMHRQVREGSYHSKLKFFFEVGALDETADRNNNGIIDAIDDTISLIDELEKKGYSRNRDIAYLELLDGRHDVDTWAKSFPDFLRWGWGVE